MAGRIVYRKIRAPNTDGGLLIEPPLAQARELLEQNRSLASQRDVDFLGQPFASFAKAARLALLQSAFKYTQRYRSVDGPSSLDPNTPIIMSGHQPQLFHAGVWFKNFALSTIAKRLDAVAVNLIVDNDLVQSNVIRVPTLQACDPSELELTTTQVPFDLPGPVIPFEERPIHDRNVFMQFAERTRNALQGLIASPLVTEVWPGAIRAASFSDNLGRCLAQARHAQEAKFGLTTLEIPLSTICDHDSFRVFALLLWSEADRLRDCYNAGLHEYRATHRIRSRSHPVPELTADDDWCEVPFWIWTKLNPNRRRLFVRRNQRCVEITDRTDFRASLGDLHSAAIEPPAIEPLLQSMRDLSDRGVRIRPRALATTMFARIVLCDLFLHGIGGGKYDQLTDFIMEQFFQLQAPAFMVLTATCHLPIAHQHLDRTLLARIELEIRRLQWNPEYYAVRVPSAAPLVEHKRRLLCSAATPVGQLRHAELCQLNRDLRSFVRPRLEELEAERDSLRARSRVDRLLSSREYSFCLFPEATLRERLLDVFDK